MMQDAFFCTVGELAAMGREKIPPQFISGAHLIYSSPATLALIHRVRKVLASSEQGWQSRILLC